MENRFYPIFFQFVGTTEFRNSFNSFGKIYPTMFDRLIFSESFRAFTFQLKYHPRQKETDIQASGPNIQRNQEKILLKACK